MRSGSNICHRPASGYVGVDVDLYKSDNARETFEGITADVEFPDTWTSSAQNDGSGIRHYRLPDGYDGLKWPGTVGDAIQFIHLGHRYAVLPPSRHPKPGDDGGVRFYRWYAPGEEVDGTGGFEIPAYEDLAELPVETIEYFTNGAFAKHLPEKKFKSVGERNAKIKAWIAEHDDDPCAAMIRAFEKGTEEFNAAAAHDTALATFFSMANLAAEGHHGFAGGMLLLHDAFIAEVGRDNREGSVRGPAEAESEWLRLRDIGLKKVMYREERGEYIGHSCTCTDLTSDGRPKPQLDVTRIDAPKAITECYTSMAATADRDWLGAYFSAGKPHILTETDWFPLDVDTMLEAVMRDVDFIKWVGGDQPIAIVQMPGRQFLGALVKSWQARSLLPELYGVTKSPFYARVGDKCVLLHENGYHPEAKVFMRMDPKLEEAVHNMGQEDKLEWAQRWIDEALAGFPFVGDADRAHAYAALILPFVRDLIEGPTPLHLITAPTAGTGKSLLADVISMVACGEVTSANGRQQVSVGKGPKVDEELGKAITSMLGSLPRVVVLDNISGSLNSPALASALTDYPMYQQRLLGGNVMAELPNRPLWMATGNQFQAVSDIGRRIAPIRLDAHMPNPSRGRSFEIDDLRAYVMDHRHRLVWAVLTLVQNWVKQGCPAGKGELGSYESWVNVIGGILQANGIPGFLGNIDEFREDSADDFHSIDDLLLEWAGGHAGVKLNEKYKARDLLVMETATESVASMKGTPANNLSMILGQHKNIPTNGFIIRKLREKGLTYFRLEEVGKPVAAKRGKKYRGVDR